jgi:hypothetical protein
MKIAALVLAILGAIAIGGVGAKWVSDYNRDKASVQAAEQLLGADAAPVKELHRVVTGGYLGIVFAVVAVVGGALVFKTPRASGAAFLAGGVIPGIFAWKMFICGGPLLIAGALALAAGFREANRRATASRAPEQQQPAFRAAA